ncbi:MAG TPA: glycogen synthase GlgA [Burkholderiales bacterium]|jgi:starch synthase|nr:glycogen synthase GlgA [Burkholderiales bacterium]
MTAANQPALKVLFATSEVAPLVKTGGLADVAGALPAALVALGVDVRVLVPGYSQVLDALSTKGRVANLPALPGLPPAQLLGAKLPSGVPLLVIDCAIYRRAGGPYQDAAGNDWPDNDLRFGLLSYVAALLATALSPYPWRPDILHCNDWQTGLAPVYLRYVEGPKARSLITIHNLAYQGIFPPETTAKLGLPPQAFAIDGVEFYGNLSFLKGGLQAADRITTVSPSYAEEIQREPLGMGMEGVLAHRRDVLVGILNGIDTDAWDPDNDPYIERYYNASRLAFKEDNRRALRARMGLEQDPETPLFGTVGRMTYQKGLDILAEVAPQLIRIPAQLVVLGSGEATLQSRFQALAQSHPGKIAVQIGFDEGLSHQIEAGADIFVMPSRYEPSGLNQMYSQRYGTPPVVHATGGLKDSVIDATPENLSRKLATGFVFSPLSADTLLAACRRAAELYRNKRLWRQIQKAGMARDFSWAASAREYLALYRDLAG